MAAAVSAQNAAKNQTNVRLCFSATNLPSLDLLSKSDPYLVLYERAYDGRWVKLGQTEVVNNNEDPTFATTFPIPYFFEKVQDFRAELFDHDNVSPPDRMGWVEFNLGNVVAGYNSTLDLPLLAFEAGKPVHKKGKPSRVQIRAEQMTQSKLKAYMKIRIRDLIPSKGKFLSTLWKAAKDDTFFTLEKENNGVRTVIYRSEVIQDSQNPSWKEFKVCLGELVDGDLNKPFIFKLSRMTIDDRPEFMGEHTIKISEIRVEQGQNSIKFDIFDKKGKDICDVMVEKCVVREEHSFIDYIKAGLDLNMVVAIDFTGSNLNPADPRSLHHVDPTGRIRNQYIDAIRSVGTILQNYCEKMTIPAMGFGGFVSIDGRPATTSHCFPLSLSTQYPYFHGVEGLVQGYVQCLARCQLSGPTYFADLIQSAAQSASRPYTPDYQHFTILLILTDGVLNDTEKTIDQICAASDKPLCILLVGVGSADFSTMHTLDGDDQQLRSKRFGPAKRDIVQFVRFLDHVNNPAQLAAECLREIPDAILSFMHMHNIQPRQNRQAPVIVDPQLSYQGSVATPAAGGAAAAVAPQATPAATTTAAPVSGGIDVNAPVPNVAPAYGYQQPTQQQQQQPAPAAQQNTGYPAPAAQTSGYPAPAAQTSGYPAPAAQTSGYPAPAAQTSGYPAPAAQTSGYPAAAAGGYGGYPAPQQGANTGYPAPAAQTSGYPAPQQGYNPYAAPR